MAGRAELGTAYFDAAYLDTAHLRGPAAASQVSASRVPASRVPASRLPAGQVRAGQVDGGQLGQLPPELSRAVGGQYVQLRAERPEPPDSIRSIDCCSCSPRATGVPNSRRISTAWV